MEAHTGALNELARSRNGDVDDRQNVDEPVQPRSGAMACYRAWTRVQQGRPDVRCVTGRPAATRELGLVA